MIRPAVPLFLAVHLATCVAVTSMALELTGTEGVARPLDFSVDATHVYLASEQFGSLDELHARHRHGKANLVLDVYSRSDGSVSARIDSSRLWGRSPNFGALPLVRMVSHGDGVVISAWNASDGSALLSFVRPTGEVGPRREVEDFAAVSLDRYRDFVLGAGTRRLMLFDEHLESQHEWMVAHTILAARATEDHIFVVDGVSDGSTSEAFATIRLLTMVEDALAEQMAVEVPLLFFNQPAPKLTIWDDLVLLTAYDGREWQECRWAPPNAEVDCGQPSWGDLTAFPDVNVQALRDLQVVRSGAGYATVVPDSCALWTRRSGRLGSTAPRQFALPTGSSGLGFVYHPLLVKEWQGGVYILTASLLNGAWWGDGEYRVVLREPDLESAPVRMHPMVPSCWTDIARGMVFSKETGMRAVSAADVDACVAKRADPNAPSNCGAWTRPLSVAARLDNVGAVQALIAAGAAVDARDEAGQTALHKAAQYAKSEGTVEALLEGGADPALRDNAGRSAWHYAKANELLSETEAVRLRPEN